MRNLPPLNALRTFECAGRHVSFVHAAEELNVTPGAVSRQVKALEDWLGAPLFHRRHRQVTLTPLGRHYLDAVSDPLAQIATATDRVVRQDTGRVLAISTYPTFALRWLVPRWIRFYDRHPDIDVQLTTSMLPVDFDHDHVDAAIQIGTGPETWPGLKAMRLVDIDLLPVCSPALQAGPTPLNAPQDLARHTLLHGAPRRQDWQRWLDLIGGVDGVDPNTGLTFDSLNLSIQAAVEGLGVAIAIKALVDDDLAAGRLVHPFGPVRRSGQPFHLVYPPERGRDRRVKAFVEWMRGEIGSGG